jgi:holo-[acyl-carrier protein] synthase
MLTTGIDILHVARVEDALARHGDRFLTRVFTPGEIAYCKGRAAALAARFAAKEAAAKALGVGMRILSPHGIGWHDAEIVNDGLGKPRLVLRGHAERLAAQLNLSEWSVSLSHERDLVVAFVVAQ